MKFTRFFILFLISIVLFSCEEKSKPKNKFTNQELITIHELADHRNTTALLPYLDSPDEALRIEAFTVMASVQDTLALEKLHRHLIEDSSEQVRQLAAYAIGQIGHEGSVTVLTTCYEKDSLESVRGAILEAVGKIGAAQYKNNQSLTNLVLLFLDKIRFHTESERIGWGKAAIRIHMAGVTNPTLMNRMAYVLQLTGRDSRIACAYAMARFKGEDWFHESSNIKYIKNWCRMERDYEVRIPQMALLGKLHDTESLEMLKGYISENQDQMVQVAAIRAAKNRSDFPISDLTSALTLKSEHAVLECISVIASKKPMPNQLPDFALIQHRSSAVQAAMMKLLVTGKPEFAERIIQGLDSAQSVYSKVHFAHALGAMPAQASFCAERAVKETELPVKYALTEAFLECTAGQTSSGDFIAMSESIFNTGDIGAQALIAQSWRSITPSKVDQERLSGILSARLSSLKLPAEVETYNEIVQTLNQWNGQQEKLFVPEFNHPIDWALVASLQPVTEVKVKTTRGDFVMEIYPEAAPGSVASFVKLANDGFFNDKYFHRVVPNFVIQGGCPRGDGMGSTDYTIRSEFALHQYGPGTLGLASSGKDTESCQWFVTNTFAPHLEGRYTILGQVVMGLEIVNAIQIGDKIEQVFITEGSPKKK